ncbi:hypothetical protein Droror1_Dr00012623 [Drosera rotundifolia]
MTIKFAQYTPAADLSTLPPLTKHLFFLLRTHLIRSPALAAAAGHHLSPVSPPDITSRYAGQNNGKIFKLDHCWEILRKCAKYSESHGIARSSATAPILLDLAEFRTLNDAVNEESPTPTIGKRPPGRKASKEKAHAKRQKSEDAQSFIGDRIVKSIEELNASSTSDIAKVNELNVEEQQMGMRLKRIQMNKERIHSINARIAMERDSMAVDQQIYSTQPSLIGSPNDAKKRLADRQAKIEELTAKADGNIFNLKA